MIPRILARCWAAIMCMHVVVAHAQLVDVPSTPDASRAAPEETDAGTPPPDEAPTQHDVDAASATEAASAAVDADDAVYRIEVRVRGGDDVQVRVLPREEDELLAEPAVMNPPPVTTPAEIAPPQVATVPATQAQPPWLQGLTVTPELQLRAREELTGHPYLDTQGSYAFATRFRARGGLTLERDMLTVRLQVQATGIFGEGLGPVGAESGLGLHQGYAQLSHDGYWLRLGRQEIALGDQRLIGALDWNMTARSLDSLRLHAEPGQWVVDAFGAVTRAQADYVDPDCRMAHPLDLSGCDVTHGSGDYVGGLYSTWKGSDALSADLYLLIRHDGANTDDWRRERDVFSPGVRAFGKVGGYLRYKAEAIYQTGRTLSALAPRRSHRAAAALGELGFEIDKEATTIMAVGAAYATGQSGKWSEFENFLPSNHRIYGVSDLIGLRNLQQEYASLNWAAPSHHLQGFVALHFLSLATPEGRWSNAGGVALNKTPVPGKSRFLGVNWDAVIRYTPSSNLWIEAGYSLFIPDAAAERYGKTDAQHLFYVWTEAKLP